MIELMLFLPISSALEFSDISVDDVTSSSARVTWRTNDYATGIVSYGTSTDLGLRQRHTNYLFYHSLLLSGLSDDTNYYYKIESRDINGTEFQDNNSGNFYTFTTDDITPPAIVTGLSSSDVTSDSVTLSWDESSAPDLKHYIIYRNREEIAYTVDTLYTDSGLSDGELYSYKVSAIDTSDNEGSMSESHFVETVEMDHSYPAISDIKVTPVSDAVTRISWKTDEPSDSKIYYGIGSIEESVNDSTFVSSHSLLLKALTPDKTYTYVITSCDANDNCVNSSSLGFTSGVDTDAPIIDVKIPSIYDQESIDITGKVEPNSKMRLYVNDMLVPVRSLSSTSTSDGRFSFYDIPLGPTNVIKIYAEDESGNNNEVSYNIDVDTIDPVVDLEDIPSIVSESPISVKGHVNEKVTLTAYLTKGSLDIPAKILDLEYLLDNSSVELFWSERSEEDFDHYVVYRDDIGPIAMTSPSDYNSYKDILVNKGSTYTYYVTAVNDKGIEGPRSDEVRVYIEDGATGLPEPNIVSDVSSVSSEPVFNKTISGDFSENIVLDDDGVYQLLLEFKDKASNTVVVEKEITLDTTPPAIDVTSPEGNSFVYENYANSLTIKGITEPNSEVHLFIERTPLGNYDTSLDISGLADDIEHISESKLRADCRSVVGSTVFCSTGADFSTWSDSRGNFEFEGVDLTSFLSLGGSISEVSLTDFSKEAELKKSRQSNIILIATDPSGLRSAEHIKYNIGTCWSGNFSWDITPLGNYQSPSVISTERLRENTEQIFFYFNYSYVGRGKDGAIKNVVVSKACSDQDVLVDKRFNISCQTLPASGSTNTKLNDQGTLSYTTVKLSSIDNMDSWLEQDWRNFFNAVSNEMTFPFKITIQYEHEVDGKKVQEVQTTCQEVTYVLDNSMVNFRELLPDWVLYDMVEYMNESISKINDIQKELKTVVEYVTIGCMGSYLLRLGMQMYRRWVTFTAEKKYFISKFLDSDLSFGSGSSDDNDYCKKVAQAIKKQSSGTKDTGFDFSGISLSSYSDADLKRCFPEVAAVWEKEADLYYLYRLSCDRLFGHETPARWTESKQDTELVQIRETAQLCDNDESPKGQALRADNCRDFDSYTGAKDYPIGKKCVDLYSTISEKGLYSISSTKISGSKNLYELTKIKDAGHGIQTQYAIKQTDSAYLTRNARTCADLCGFTEDKNKIFDENILNNLEQDIDKYTSGGYGCVTAKTCDALELQYSGVSGSAKITGAERRGYSSDCFYKAGNTLSTKLNDVNVVSTTPELRYECCCINAEKVQPSTYYHYDDEVLYSVGGEQPAYAFENVGSDGVSGNKPNSYDEMQWSYRYWKEGFTTAGVTVIQTETKTPPGGDSTLGGDIVIETKETTNLHNSYNKDRYISGRDYPACFGQDYILDKITKRPELILNPAKDFVATFQCLHVAGIHNRLQVLKNMMTALSSCLITIRTTGTADAGVCKELFTQYVCALIWKVIQLFRTDGCVPIGGLVKYDSGGEGTLATISSYTRGAIDSVWGSVADSQSEITSEYGNAKLNNLLGEGEQAVARKICLAAFGYDWEINLNDVMDAAYASPYATLVQAMSGTREYLTIDPSTSKAQYEYRASWLINPGCDLRNYKVELSCVSSDEANKYPGINCESVKDPSGINCACLSLSEEKRHPFYTSNTKDLSQGILEDIDYHDLVTDYYRYDHLKFTLNLDQGIKGSIKGDCFPDGHEDGVFYFPLRDKTMVDVLANCQISNGQFICSPPGFFWTTKANAYFSGEPRYNNKEYSKISTPVLYKGESLTIQPTVQNLGNYPVCIAIDIDKGNYEERQTYFIGTAGEHSPSIEIDDSIDIYYYSYGSKEYYANNQLCSPKTVPNPNYNVNVPRSEENITCKNYVSGQTIDAEILNTYTQTNLKDQKRTFHLKFYDEDDTGNIELSASSNDKVEVSVTYEDQSDTIYSKTKISSFWSSGAIRINDFDRDSDGKADISLKINSVGYGSDNTASRELEYIQYDIPVYPSQQKSQFWQVTLSLKDPGSNTTNCDRISNNTISYAGKVQKKTMSFTVKSEPDPSANDPEIVVSSVSNIVPSELRSYITIPVTITDDVGVTKAKYFIKTPDGGKTVKEGYWEGTVNENNPFNCNTNDQKKLYCHISFDYDELYDDTFMTTHDSPDKNLRVGGDYILEVYAYSKSGDEKSQTKISIPCTAGKDPYGYCIPESDTCSATVPDNKDIDEDTGIACSSDTICCMYYSDTGTSTHTATDTETASEEAVTQNNQNDYSSKTLYFYIGSPSPMVLSPSLWCEKEKQPDGFTQSGIKTVDPSKYPKGTDLVLSYKKGKNCLDFYKQEPQGVYIYGSSGWEVTAFRKLLNLRKSYGNNVEVIYGQENIDAESSTVSDKFYFYVAPNDPSLWCQDGKQPEGYSKIGNLIPFTSSYPDGTDMVLSFKDYNDCLLVFKEEGGTIYKYGGLEGSMLWVDTDFNSLLKAKQSYSNFLKHNIEVIYGQDNIESQMYYGVSILQSVEYNQYEISLDTDYLEYTKTNDQSGITFEFPNTAVNLNERLERTNGGEIFDYIELSKGDTPKSLKLFFSLSDKDLIYTLRDDLEENGFKRIRLEVPKYQDPLDMIVISSGVMANRFENSHRTQEIVDALKDRGIIKSIEFINLDSEDEFDHDFLLDKGYAHWIHLSYDDEDPKMEISLGGALKYSKTYYKYSAYSSFLIILDDILKYYQSTKSS